MHVKAILIILFLPRLDISHKKILNKVWITTKKRCMDCVKDDMIKM